MGSPKENHYKNYPCDCRGFQKLALISGPGLDHLKLDARSPLLYLASGVRVFLVRVRVRGLIFDWDLGLAVSELAGHSL